MRRDLAALAGRQHDVLVVGGGIHGAFVAWDAAQRGLATALVEGFDFGSGSSWNSLKTIHGGLRHLQRADVRGLRESSREQRALLAIAPEVVRPLPFLVPTYGHGARGREVMALALRAYDLLGASGNGHRPIAPLPRSRMLAPEEVRARCPGLPAQGLTGGALWHEAQVSSSERLLMGVLHAAAGAGAVLANYAPVTTLLREGARVVGATIGDGDGRGTLEVRARVVVVAAGSATARLTATAGAASVTLPHVRARNLVLRRAPIEACAVGGRSGARFLFLVPWAGRSIVGTHYEEGPANGAAAPAEAAVEALLAEARQAFPWAGLSRADVALVHEGAVPGRSSTRLVTRHRVVDHQAADGVDGLVSLHAAKYTTARAAAEGAVDAALRKLGRPAVASRTAVTPLAAASPLPGPLEERARAAVRDEMARHLDDAVRRRLDLGTAGPADPADVATVARVMATELGWDAARLANEQAALP